MTELDQQTSPGDKRADGFPLQNACCSGHCDSGALPAPLEPVKETLATADIQTPIRILQMDCPTEEGLLRKKLGGMAGVTALEFNLMQRTLAVRHELPSLFPVEQALTAIGFLDPQAPRKLMPRLNQLFNRAGVTEEEIHILRGMAKMMLKPQPQTAADLGRKDET